MSEGAMKPNMAMCEGCLAADRTLAKLGKRTFLFNQLVASLDPDIEPSMCWECISMFNKIYKFQQQVSQAQFILKSKHEFEPEYECLSTLNKSNRIDYYDLEIEHKENEGYECPVVKLESIDQLINHYLDCNVDNNSDKDDKNYCTADAAFFDIDEKHAVTIKENNKDDSNDINYYDENDCKNEVNDGDQSSENFGELSLDNENSEMDNGGSLKTKSKKISRIPQKRLRYNVVIDLNDGDKHFKKVEVDKQELLDYMEKERSTNYESNSKINCDLCLSKFSSEERLRQHEKMWHSKSNKWTCDICKRTYPTRSKLKVHIYKHSKYLCLPCGHVTYTRHQMTTHVKFNHQKLWECVKCQMRFPSSQNKEFYQHYRDMHMSFICDYCGKKFNTKSRVECHIRKNHAEYKCKECNLTYTAYRHLMYHNSLKHSAPQTSEDTYCVECDIQFHNVLKFKSHLYSSKHHRPSKVTERVPCLGCDKTYASKYFMLSHYNLVHLKKTKYFCEKCSRYFPNKNKLQIHINSIHLKIPPVKNKLCPHCGRGFSEMRILTHHIRTHTGERPFSCEHCPAAFAQKIAYQIHVKSKHKETLTQSNVQSKLMNK